MTDGATRDEAVRNAQRVGRKWIETARELGRPIPEPSGACSTSERGSGDRITFFGELTHG
jgi:predicted RNase H-like HicB family nuclease